MGDVMTSCLDCADLRDAKNMMFHNRYLGSFKVTRQTLPRCHWGMDCSMSSLFIRNTTGLGINVDLSDNKQTADSSTDS